MAKGELIASVVIPAYNAEATISECIEAVLQQSVPRSQFEVIVVDDGSTDATQEIATRYGVKVLSQPHRGVGAARNLGVDQAEGEIILFTDADCAPAHDWIETLMQPFQNSEISGAKGIYKTCQRELIARFAQLEYEDKYDKMSKDKYIDFVDTYCAAYRKSVFSKDGAFDPTFHRSGEDIDLSYRLSRRGYKLVFTPEAVVYHRHVDTLLDYFRRKFYVGLWRVLMYRKSPEKMVADSHTPYSLKLQCILATFSIALLLAFPLFPKLAIWGLSASLVLFLLFCLPFLAKCVKRDPGVGLVALPLVLVRAFALTAGFLIGIMSQPYFTLRGHPKR